MIREGLNSSVAGAIPEIVKLLNSKNFDLKEAATQALCGLINRSKPNALWVTNFDSVHPSSAVKLTFWFFCSAPEQFLRQEGTRSLSASSVETVLQWWQSQLLQFATWRDRRSSIPACCQMEPSKLWWSLWIPQTLRFWSTHCTAWKC